MKKLITLGLLTLLTSSLVNADDGLVKHKSPFTVKETADKFISIAEGKGLNVFARIDHSANAAKVNMTLRPTTVVIFGNPKVGTPLMQCTQNVGIDLPQKVLITEDANQQVWLSYNHPSYLKARHNIEGCDGVLEKITAVLGKLSAAAVSQ